MYKMGYQQQVYKKAHLETANPGQILIMLYDAAIRFVKLGKQQIDAGDIPGKGVSLGKAYAIIAEFINALDYTKAPELCANLEAIYGFMLEKLASSNTSMSSEGLVPVITHLENLRTTWAEAVVAAALEEENSTSRTAAR